MTEYDYSPEAYEKYLAKQQGVARWAYDTSQHPQADPYTPLTPFSAPEPLPVRDRHRSKSISHPPRPKTAPPTESKHRRRDSTHRRERDSSVSPTSRHSSSSASRSTASLSRSTLMRSQTMAVPVYRVAQQSQIPPNPVRSSTLPAYMPQPAVYQQPYPNHVSPAPQYPVYGYYQQNKASVVQVNGPYYSSPLSPHSGSYHPGIPSPTHADAVRSKYLSKPQEPLLKRVFSIFSPTKASKRCTRSSSRGSRDYRRERRNSY